MKKGLLCAAALLLLCVIAPFSAHSAQRRSFSALEGCKSLCAISSSQGAFFYGWSSDTLVCAKAIPEGDCFSCKTERIICCACHDCKNTYALLRGSDRSYSLLTLDPGGSARTTFLDSGIEINNRSLAVSGNEVFLISNTTDNSVRSYRTDGGRAHSYSFSDEPMTLFNNGGKAYLQTCRGEVYRLGGGKAEFCCTVGTYGKLCDAGEGWVMCDGARLYSLNGEVSRSISADYGCAVIDGGTLCYRKNSELHIGSQRLEGSYLRLAAHGGRLACLDSGFNCTIISEAEPSSGGAPSASFNGRLEPGTTVAQLRDILPDAEVFASDGTSVKSGAMKTGYTVNNGSKAVAIIVSGDVTGNGKCTASDRERLMEHLCGSGSLSGCYLGAADMNGDNKASNADLILLLR